MTSFQVEASRLTPRVHLDASSSRLALEGDCYPENPVVFFAPLFRALEEHLAAARPESFVADFRLRYVNSASTVALHRLFALLDRASEGGTRIRIDWAHDPDDDVNEELGHDLSSGCRHALISHRAA